MEERGCANDVADSAELDDQNLRLDRFVVRAGFSGFVNAMDAGEFMRFAGNVATEKSAVSLQWNHVGARLLYLRISRME